MSAVPNCYPPRRRVRLSERLREAGAVVVFMAGVFAASFVLAALLGGCAQIGYAVSAASGFYTHDRIDQLEDRRIDVLEDRVRVLEATQ